MPTDIASIMIGLATINATSSSTVFFAVSRIGGNTATGQANANANTNTM